MGRSVLAAALVLTALLVVQLPAGDSQDICFSNSGCTGAQISASSARDCCVGTDDGLSYGSPGTCRECIVHGFNMVAYTTEEDSSILSGTFGINRKGRSTILSSIPGTIMSVDINTTESADYLRLMVTVGSVNSEEPFELDLVNDNLALEFKETLLLNFTVNSASQVLVGLAQLAGEFIRSSAIVSITDNDDLAINFDEQDRSEIENAAIPLEDEVTLSLRPTQIPFTIEITHATITDALDEDLFDLAGFLSDDVTDSVHASPGSDFVNFSYREVIPAMTATITLRNVSILDDNKNEAEEVFILVIKLLGVAGGDTACFQIQRDGQCMGNTGGIVIKIRDNDPMVIGFATRNTTIRENKFPAQDSFMEQFNVVSFRASELVYTITFSVTGQRTADVVAEGQEFSSRFPDWDASFGGRQQENPRDPPFIEADLTKGLLMLAQNLQLTIHNDVNAEETESFTLRITAGDVGRLVFDCYDDTEEPVLGNFLCSHTFFIVDEDIPLNVSFVETVYTVVESDEMVEVCVNLTMPDADILDNTVNVEVFVDDDSIYIPSNAPLATGRLPPPFLPEPSRPFDEDYPQQLLGFNDLRAIQILETRRTICYDQTVYDDVRLEANEYTGLTLTIGASTARTETGIDHTSIIIIDDDVARVGIVPTFRQVSETVGLVEICAMVFEPNITCPIEFDFDVSLSTSDGSAVNTLDYEEVDTILMFRSCETRACTNVTIVDDNVAELTERFFVRLGRTVGLDTRITLDPVEAEIEITDGDVIVVGYEMTTYTTTEGMGYVELCAVITNPSMGVVSPRPFVISATTADDTAVAPGDYEEVVDFELVFNIGDNRVCHNVTINDDNECEQPAESFLSRLSYVSGELPITIDPEEARVFIDDTAEPECADIVVGYEFTTYTTTESIGSVTLCAVIFEPISGVSPRPFTISATTQDGTAMAAGDYEAVVGEQLVFNTGDDRQCHTVNIVDDDDCEQPAEDFFSNLMFVSGQQVVTINRPQAEVVIDDDNEPECEIIVGYEFTSYTTTETMGSVTLCAIIYNPPSGVAPRPFTISATTQDGTAIAPGDYEAVDGEQLVFNTGDRRQCHTVNIVNDDDCEQPAENFFSDLSYVSGELPVTINPDRTTVFIDDDNEAECDPIVVGYRQTVYTTTEGQGMVELCATISTPSNGIAPRPLVLVISTSDGTAVSPADYTGVSIDSLLPLTLFAGDTVACHTLQINDDDLCEQPPEHFFSVLTYGAGLMPITVDPDRARVVINDDTEDECNITVGYEETVYTISEMGGSVTLCAIIYNPPSGVAPRPFTISATTQDGTAIAPGDYGAVVGEPLVFNAGDSRQCHTVTIVDDDICEEPLTEHFLSDLAFVSGQQVITINPAQARVAIVEDGEECTILVNDTVTGDPLMTVPIFTDFLTDEDVGPGESLTSLCYEVHGEADGVFNLVSDTCVTVNGHYAKAPINSSNIDLNIVDAIGVRAVSDGGTCENIRVGQQGCQATVNGVDINGMYRRDGISVREYANRVRIVVPNCANIDLVMWVFCMNGQTEDSVTEEIFNFNFIRFVVRRGLNLAEESHGLIGQFWNVPIDLTKYTGDFGGAQRDDSYTITVNHPGSDARSFVGILWSVTWEFEHKPCLYVGNSQAGPLGEEDVDPNDSVIEGSYVDYRVDSMFSSNFTFSYFDEEACEPSVLPSV